MFCAPALVFYGTEGVGSRFPVWCARTYFLRYRGRRVPFSYFARPNSFSDETRELGPVFIFLHARTRFRPYRGRRLPFSCFALPDSFSAEPRALVPVFMFCAPRLAFGVTDGVEPHFNVLHSRTRFWLYRGSRIPFSCFARPDSFSAVPRASGPVYMFCAPGLVFGGNEGVGSRFHVLRSRTHFWRYRWRRIPFSCFVLPNSFSVVPRASAPVFMFCAPELIYGGTEGVGSRFHVLQARTRFVRYRGHRVPFSYLARPHLFSAVPSASAPVFFFCAPTLIFGCNEGVGSRFHFFARPDSFSAVPWSSAPVFMFCTPGLIFGGTEGVGSIFHVLRARTRFRRYRRCRASF
jgi:hypothetical protein